MMKEKVIIYGASTLDRYTKGILVDGFRNNGWGVEASDIDKKPEEGTILFQLHGSPQAVEEDKKITDRISEAIAENDSSKLIILVHRPDEIQILHPNFDKVLATIVHPTGLVLLGDKHLEDDFFKADKTVRSVIPHGFFDLSQDLQTDPVVIGTNTTWGEMRSTEHALRLLTEVFRLNPESRVVGYLGGKPADKLDIVILKEEVEKVAPDFPVQFIDLGKFSFKDAVKQKGNIVLVQNGGQSDDFSLTYNTQLYFLGKKVRTGESSGSVHISSGVPVILEMNGSESIEGLEVVKIPYSDVSDINSVDYKAGATEIVTTINDKSFIGMIGHNQKQAKKFNNTYVTSQYINLFQALAR